MELNEAARRILGLHWRLIVVCVIIGAAAAPLVHVRSGTVYTSSTRLVLDTQDPKSRTESTAIADTAKAIATSPTQVSDALQGAGITGRDPSVVANKHVSVTALGTSGVLKLSVTDRDPKAAAAIANALAAAVIRTRLDVTNGEARRIAADLDGRISGLDARIAKLDARITNATGTLRDSLFNTRDVLSQQRSALQVERVGLLSTESARPKPSVISAASAPARADSKGVVTDAVLGGIIGLIVGLGLAALLESVRPTLVGGDALARELGSAYLGDVRDDDETATAGIRLAVAAHSAGVANVGLLSAHGHVDLASLADRLADAVAATDPNGAPGRSPRAVVHSVVADEPGGRVPRRRPENPVPAAPGDLSVYPFNLQNVTRNGQGRIGVVLVAPPKLRKAELVETGRILAASRWPLLGVVTMPPPGPALLETAPATGDVDGEQASGGSRAATPSTRAEQSGGNARMEASSRR